MNLDVFSDGCHWFGVEFASLDSIGEFAFFRDLLDDVRGLGVVLFAVVDQHFVTLIEKIQRNVVSVFKVSLETGFLNGK